MDVGLTIPTRGPLATRQGIETMARRAEELGFAHLSLSDHVVVPRKIDSRYPYSESGEWAGAASGDCFEQFTQLAWLAAITTKPRLITAVAVIPYRGAVHTAKIAATIDVLSEGRMVLGIGAGWLREEFEALGSPPFEERGRVTDEYLQAFKILWTEDGSQAGAGSPPPCTRTSARWSRPRTMSSACSPAAGSGCVWTPGICSSAVPIRRPWRPSMRDGSGIRTSRMWMRPGRGGCSLVR